MEERELIEMIARDMWNCRIETVKECDIPFFSWDDELEGLREDVRKEAESTLCIVQKYTLLEGRTADRALLYGVTKKAKDQ